LTLPDRLAHAPGEGAAYYDIGFKTSGGLSSAGYTLEAVPVSTSPQAADPCGTLLFTQAGARGARDAFTPEATVARCWGR
jgi:Tfp pilus assembly protein PilE